MDPKKTLSSALQGAILSVASALAIFGVLDVDRANALAAVAVSFIPLFAAVAVRSGRRPK
ncbi:MAG: hypothetical protein WCO96_01245 [Actinomycetes bacterium]|jgi:hypothetical protein